LNISINPQDEVIGMFKISPIQSEQRKRECAEKCGTSPEKSYFAYQMVNEDTGELMGMSQFEICGEDGYISDLRSAVGYEDFEAMFILGRATMNFIDLCSCHKCRAKSDAGEKRLLTAIGFKEADNGEYFCDMTDMFSGHCDGKTVNIE
jgi:hypothetical protein